MSQELSRRSLLKLAGAASAAGLTVGVIDPPKAEASLTIVDAVIDFGHNVDRVMIKALLNGVPPGNDTLNFTVRVIVTDVRAPDPVIHDSGNNPVDAFR